MGLSGCQKSGEKGGRCKEMFIEAWSEELVLKNSRTVGLLNRYGEPFYRGEHVYRESAEGVMYKGHRSINGRKSELIQPFFSKY